jgi:hypothetical protein
MHTRGETANTERVETSNAIIFPLFSGTAQRKMSKLNKNPPSQDRTVRRVSLFGAVGNLCCCYNDLLFHGIDVFIAPH